MAHTHPLATYSRADSQRFLKLTDIAVVRKKIESALKGRALKTEQIPIDTSLGRVAAEDVVSEIDLPPMDISAMDGYALRSSALASASPKNPARFTIRGSVYPNNVSPDFSEKLVDDATTFYVATGGPIPEGCDVVARVEDTRLDQANNSILIMKDIPKGKNIAPKGEDIRSGQRLVKKGEILNASNVAMLIGIGKRKVRVFGVPTVGIVSIGNELQELNSSEPSSDSGQSSSKLVNNYAYLISGFLAELGAHALLLGIARDDKNEIASLIRKGIEKTDVVITIAGSSVGARDFTPNSILSLEDSQIIFHGMKVVPIRPAGLALVKNKPVIIVPGHAVSAALTFYVLILPILNLLSGLPLTSRRVLFEAESTKEFSNERPIQTLFLVTVKRDEGEDGVVSYSASPLEWGSNLILALSKANGFVWVKPKQKISKSEKVAVQLFGGTELLNRIV